jgi:hypothetical protein
MCPSLFDIQVHRISIDYLFCYFHMFHIYICSFNSVKHINYLAFDWQYMCYIWWTCFLANSRQTHVYQLSYSSCQLVILIVTVDQENHFLQQVHSNLLVRCQVPSKSYLPWNQSIPLSCPQKRYFFIIISWFYTSICVCTNISFLILQVQLSNKWHLFVHQYTAGFNNINLLIVMDVNIYTGTTRYK